jgi:putative two-component system hydrogenase maturation factor HypX/HoxX
VDSAKEITLRRLPMGAKEAVACGLADRCFGQAGEDFLPAALEHARALAAQPGFPGLLDRKRELRARDEAAKPLQRYRDEELERMKLNFYGFDPSYHVARYHFVYKLPKARTPGYLAPHRARPRRGEGLSAPA